jgi:DNA polymerase III epsilon subunit family exonuclease
MKDLIIVANQKPGQVTFDNFNEVKNELQQYINNSFSNVDYSVDGIEAAIADKDELKRLRDTVSKRQKELKEAYSAPYVAVEKMLNELLDIIDEPYKTAKTFVEQNEKLQKQEEIMRFAHNQALKYGEEGKKIVESPAFFNKDWMLKKYTVKKYQDEISAKLQKAVSDANSIKSSGGKNIQALMARFYDTLSMDGVESFLKSLEDNYESQDINAVEEENSVVGYKILKITATEDQMASILDQLKLMRVDVEEIEDGMPKPMIELTVPDFNSFVAFDIETTGTNGAANGDDEAQITEIGAVRIVDGKVVDKFDELANPGREILPRISRLTHITNDMVADKPPVSEVIGRFKEFVGDSILVGHNIKSSDLHYITKAANKSGVKFDMPFLDTYILAKQFKAKMGWEKVNLQYLSNFYGFEHKEAHRAWSDAEVNAQVYFELQKLRG